jgi:plasmid stabilization system protein ParE
MEHTAARRRLRQVIETAALRIGQHPRLGRQEPALADARYRFWSASGLPYLLVYRAEGDELQLARTGTPADLFDE